MDLHQYESFRSEINSPFFGHITHNYLLCHFLKYDSCLLNYIQNAFLSIEDVPDKMFAGKQMGDGIAFKFDGNIVCAPCDGKISMVANTLHAFGITNANGAEILVHIGLDTVELNSL